MSERPRFRQDVPARHIETERGSKSIRLEEIQEQRDRLENELRQRVQEARDEDHVRQLIAEYEPRLEQLEDQIRAFEKDVFDVDTEK